MKIEQLLNLDVSIDLHGGVLHLQRQSTPGGVPHGKIDVEHDSVYFGADSSPNSFSGHLSGGLQDDEVIEFIRRNNGALYDRLWGSRTKGRLEPVTSSIPDHRNHSDSTAGDPKPSNLANSGDGNMVDAAGASNRSRAGPSSSIALPDSPSSMAIFDSCSIDIHSALPCLEPMSLPASRSKAQLQQDLYLLQQRRYIQSLLLNDHILVLQKVPAPEAKVRSRSCDHPLCTHRHGIPPGAYRLSLESRKTLGKSTATTDKYHSPKDDDGGKYLKVRSANSRGFYCLTCVEDLFEGVGMLDEDYTTSSSALQASLVPQSLPSAPISVDGSANETPELRTIIFEAAEQLLPSARLAKQICVRTDATLTVDFTKHQISDPLTAASALIDFKDSASTQLSSNSDAAIVLRDAKRQDTEATLNLLCKVTSRRQARRLSQFSSDGELPSLRVSRPIGLPGRKERYKKQGLGERDWRLWRKSLLAPHFQMVNSASINVNVKEDDEGQHLGLAERFCYCRELEDLERIFSCDAEFCLTGWFHLKCSGLPRLPMRSETWFCNECSALFGPGTFNHTLTALSHESNFERSRVLRRSARAASGSTDRKESGNTPSDEFSTDETSLPLSDDEIIDPTYNLPMTPRRQSKRAVGMNFTPSEFLDGASENKSALRNPIRDGDTTTTAEIICPAMLPSIKDESDITKSKATHAKRASSLTLQGDEEPKTPTKRRKRISSPPPRLVPPSRYNKTSFGHLAPFLYAETRTSAAALSNPQIVALEKWKSIHLYSPLIEVIQSPRSEPATPRSSGKNSQQISPASTIPPNVAALELGGTVIEIPCIHGKKLSQILLEVDNIVEEQLRKQGSTGWEQGVLAREEAVKIGKAKGSQVDEQNGMTSPRMANEVRRRISRCFTNSKQVE